MPALRMSMKDFNAMAQGTENLIQRTIDGKNPHIDFTYDSLSLPRGNVAHPPNTDWLEVRNSITVQFSGASNGVKLAHLFPDGTYKTSEQMHRENRQRADRAAQLKAEEDRFPRLGQTAARLAAWQAMITRIRALRDNQRMSLMAKQTERANAMLAYDQFERDQAQARIAAAEAARKAGRR